MAQSRGTEDRDRVTQETSHGESARAIWPRGDWTVQTNGEAEHHAPERSSVRLGRSGCTAQNAGRDVAAETDVALHVSTPTPQTHKRRGRLNFAQCRASSASAHRASSATGMRLRPFPSSRLLALPSLAALGFCFVASRAPMLFGRAPTLSRGMISRTARHPSSSTATTSLTTLGGVLGSKLARLARADDTAAFLIARDVLLPPL